MLHRVGKDTVVYLCPKKMLLLLSSCLLHTLKTHLSLMLHPLGLDHVLGIGRGYFSPIKAVIFVLMPSQAFSFLFQLLFRS